MMKMNRVILAAGMALLVCATAGTLQAQEADNGGGQGRRMGGGRFDMTQVRQQMEENLRSEMGATNDTEWGVIKARLDKVMDARQANMGDVLRGMRMGMRRNGGNGEGGDRPRQGGNGGPRAGGMMGQPSAELQALEKVLAKDGATKEELKAAVTKVVEARKAHQAALEKAQADLRQVLTTRQEAVLTANGLL